MLYAYGVLSVYIDTQHYNVQTSISVSETAGTV